MDIIGIVGILHLFGFMIFIETISIRLNKKVKKKYVLYYVLAWMIALFIFLVAINNIFQIGKQYESIIGEVIMLGVGFIILDFAILIVVKALYYRFSFFKRYLGHDMLREKWKNKRKNKLKKEV